VAARKSITALSHFSMESSSETCTCRHLPALHPVAFPTSFQSVFCWSFHRLQWRKRCSRVWVSAAALSPLPHHRHVSSSLCPNRFKSVESGCQRLRTIHWDGSLAPSFAFQSVAVMFAVFVGLPLSLRRRLRFWDLFGPVRRRGVYSSSYCACSAAFSR
jgi:hypothetical protein